MTGPVPSALDGERLDRVVALVAGVSRAVAADAIAAGSVLVDGVVETVRSRRLSAGQELAVDASVGAEPPPPGPDPSIPVPVVYEDDHLLIVDKPAGLVVHPGAGHPDGTLVNGLLARDPALAAVGDPARPGIVHRLDRGTSGLLLVARTQVAYEALVAMLADRRVERVYLALVWGVPDAGRGLIDAPIGRSPRDPTRMAVVDDGRAARTRYQVERVLDHGRLALVRCWLETGRTHQIRVHLAAIGHPVVGDATYGGVRPGLDAPRLMLHAWRLAFEHPGSGQPVTFEAPLPSELTGVLAGLS